VPPTRTIAPVLVAELLVEGERWPVYVHVIDHPTPACLSTLHDGAASRGRGPRSRLIPLSKQDFDLVGIDVVVNTYLHFDHCGGNERLICVQGQLEDARNKDDYTIRDWVQAPGVR
jgi:N-acyl homoserine lactone hydrolase